MFHSAAVRCCCFVEQFGNVLDNEFRAIACLRQKPHLDIAIDRFQDLYSYCRLRVPFSPTL